MKHITPTAIKLVIASSRPLEAASSRSNFAIENSHQTISSGGLGCGLP